MFELREEPIADLREYAGISGEFESHSIYDVRQALNAVDLVERSIPVPFRKDYDRFEDPTAWSRTLGAAQSVCISAFAGVRRVGGIIAAVATPGLVTWENNVSVAILWDLRVAQAYRRKSVATSLLSAAAAWAQARACSELKVETQNTNPAACRFYMQRGFVLQEARPGAYSELPADVQLIWRKRLDG